MIFTQYYLDCLSQASYLVGDEVTGQAVVIDPRRDVEEYLADASAAGLTIMGVINPHFHAYFASAPPDLPRPTGACSGCGGMNSIAMISSSSQRTPSAKPGAATMAW